MLGTIKLPQSLIPVKARLKLQQRHLREWNALTVDQQAILKLIKEETAQKISVTNQDKRACLELKNKQSVRLIKVLERQQGERQQMMKRQQKEKDSLEQVIEDSRLNSTN
jgi:TRAP-type C4-dicarboxylate transport system substrate-binding protein